MSPWNYDVIGYHGGDFGLAIAARQTLEALRSSGRGGREIRLQPRSPPTIRERLAQVSVRPASMLELERIRLFHVNPMEIAEHAHVWRAESAPGAWNACVPFWELPLVPRVWEPILQGMEAILAPSRFVADACTRAVGPDRVLHYPQFITTPRDAVPVRSLWGLHPTSTIFLVSFDAGSGIERKNPWAALEAFRRAFPGSEDVQLVVKTRPWPTSDRFVVHRERLREEASSDPRIVVVDRTLPYADVMRLYASCDAMLSLHRSEGLGLHLMEAMSLGKVVVATGWSGNVDFMTESNSMLVTCDLVPVRPSHTEYLPEMGRDGQVWAEPNIDEAARALRRIHFEAGWKEAIGGRAAVDMEQRRALALSGTTFTSIEKLLGASRRRSLGRAIWTARRRLTLRAWARHAKLSE